MAGIEDKIRDDVALREGSLEKFPRKETPIPCQAQNLAAFKAMKSVGISAATSCVSSGGTCSRRARQPDSHLLTSVYSGWTPTRCSDGSSSTLAAAPASKWRWPGTGCAEASPSRSSIRDALRAPAGFGPWRPVVQAPVDQPRRQCVRPEPLVGVDRRVVQGRKCRCVGEHPGDRRCPISRAVFALGSSNSGLPSSLQVEK